jgi:hypothetical protein
MHTPLSASLPGKNDVNSCHHSSIFSVVAETVSFWKVA